MKRYSYKVGPLLFKLRNPNFWIFDSEAHYEPYTKNISNERVQKHYFVSFIKKVKRHTFD